MFRIFCILTYWYSIPQIKTDGIFVVKVHSLPCGIYLHRNLPFLLGYRPARNHLQKRAFRAEPQRSVLFFTPSFSCFLPYIPEPVPEILPVSPYFSEIPSANHFYYCMRLLLYVNYKKAPFWQVLSIPNLPKRSYAFYVFILFSATCIQGQVPKRVSTMPQVCFLTAHSGILFPRYLLPSNHCPIQ